MITTTLNAIRSHYPCESGWKKLLTKLGKTSADNETLDLLTVLESNGLDDTLWCLQCVTDIDRDARLFAVWCARQAQHLMKDRRSLDALDVAERFANGAATYDELDAARAAAWAAAGAAAWAAAGDTAGDTAWAAAWAAAGAAAWAAAGAAAGDAAGDAAWAAAWAAAGDAQKAMFIQMCNGTAPWQVAA